MDTADQPTSRLEYAVAMVVLVPALALVAAMMAIRLAAGRRPQSDAASVAAKAEDKREACSPRDIDQGI